MDHKTDVNDVKEGFIEIERKFIFDQDSEYKLLQNGAKLVEQLSFSDVYYDNQSHDLIVNNYWLRCRDGQWQLKCPPTDTQDLEYLCTLQYAEYDQPSDILKQVKYVLAKSHRLRESTSGGSTEQVKPDNLTTRFTSGDQLQESGVQSHTPLDEILKNDSGDNELKIFLRRNDFKPFANFRTKRTKYRVGDDITVDLDVADFGYSVGEIEVMVKTGQPREEAFKKINDFAQKLGVYGEENVPGKLVMYLEKHQLELYSLIKKTFKL